MDVFWSLASSFLGAILLAYFYVTRNFSYWSDRGVVGPKPTPFFGNFKDVLLQKISPGDFLAKIYRESAESPYTGFFILDKPALLIRDPDVIKNVLIKDASHFADHYHVSSLVGDPLLHKGLFMLKGERWKQMRADMSPVFTPGRLKKMFPLVLECGNELDKHTQKIAGESKPVEIRELLAKSSVDVITSCAFGINSNCMTNPNAEFREFGKAIFDVISPRRGFEIMAVFFLPWLSKIIRIRFFPQQTTDFLREVLWETLIAREKSKTKRDDVIDHLIQLKNRGKRSGEYANLANGSTLEKNDNKEFAGEKDDLIAQAATLYAGGFESSSSTLTYGLYELAMSPEIQNKARKDILEVIARHGGQITYEGVQEMKYLESVVYETLRKHPFLPFLDRICKKDYTIPGTNLKIEKGTPIYFSLFGLHQDPEYFPEPEKFLPERFSDEEKHKIRNCTFMPFGEGPRLCVAMRFGMMAVKTQLANILSHCEVCPNADTPKRLLFNERGTIMALKGDIPLIFTKIST